MPDIADTVAGAVLGGALGVGTSGALGVGSAPACPSGRGNETTEGWFGAARPSRTTVAWPLYDLEALSVESRR